MVAKRRRRLSPEPVSREDDRPTIDSIDSIDVPAAVLCALCGKSDCSGNCQERASGIFVLVPWERELPWQRRLFATARATTVDCEELFANLPDGPVAPALSFALMAELVAALGVALLVAVPAMLLFPDLARACVWDPSARRIALRTLFFGVPGLACLLALAHAAHGLSVDVGGRRHGGRQAPASRTLALRFGLYAAGWDLIVGPVGAVYLLFSEGPRAAASVLGRAAGLPTRSTLAFLKGAYRLEGEAAAQALRVSYWGAGISTVVASAVIIGTVVAAIAW